MKKHPEKSTNFPVDLPKNFLKNYFAIFWSWLTIFIYSESF